MRDATPSLKRVFRTAGVCAAFAAVYAVLGREPPPLAAGVVSFAPLVSCALWIRADAQRQELTGSLDWGLWVWALWPALFPWYSLATRGRRGWPLLLALIAAVLLPAIAAMAGAALRLFSTGAP
jgi:hypothetical protein